MISEPINDFTCLGKFTGVARNAVERKEIQQLADRFLQRADHWIDPALKAAQKWLRNKNQVNDSGHGPEPRVDCGDVQQRVDYMGREPNCVERTIAYTAIAELIDPESIRQMATIKTRAGLHTFPVEDGQPVVLDPFMKRNALHLGLYALRNGAEGNYMRPHELVEFCLDLAEEPAAAHRNGLRRVDNAERALSKLWRKQLIGNNPKSFRNSIADIAWTFALAEQAARVAGGHGLDAVRVASMAVQRMLEPQARNWSFNIGGYKIGIDIPGLKTIERGARQVLRTAEQVARSAGPAAGPVLKAFLLTQGIPPQFVDQLAGQVSKSAGIDLGPLGLQQPPAGSLDALALQQAVNQLAIRHATPATPARTKTQKKGKGGK